MENDLIRKPNKGERSSDNVAKAKAGGAGGGLRVVSDGWGDSPQTPQILYTIKSQARLFPGLTRQRDAVRSVVSARAQRVRGRGECEGAAS